ncbi:MAG TPA: hypothetical protein VJK52_05590 [Candidatus Nanoarchaeia archaeon]|nr:hypothetical protein [Candidatus Nanoarchaeia archaeon]
MTPPIPEDRETLRHQLGYDQPSSWGLRERVASGVLSGLEGLGAACMVANPVYVALGVGLPIIQCSDDRHPAAVKDRLLAAGVYAATAASAYVLRNSELFAELIQH